MWKCVCRKWNFTFIVFAKLFLCLALDESIKYLFRNSIWSHMFKCAFYDFLIIQSISIEQYLLEQYWRSIKQLAYEFSAWQFENARNSLRIESEKTAEYAAEMLRWYECNWNKIEFYWNSNKTIWSIDIAGMGIFSDILCVPKMDDAVNQ